MKKLYLTILVLLVLVMSYIIILNPTRDDNPPILPDITIYQKPKPENKIITLNFVGDILAARSVELTMRKQGYDYPFAKIVDRLQDADITFANLETPLIGTATSGKTTVGGTTVFRGDVAFADALKKAGIDIVSIANNHMKDQGERGVLSTVKTLDTAGILHAGGGANLDAARTLVITEAQGIKIGYLAYNDADVVPSSYHATDMQSGSNIMDLARLKEDLARARSQVDVLIVSMHSGTEYITDYANAHQIAFAHAAIEGGADVVIGHHPHVLEPLEIYKGKYIFYSLGNFVFDQPWPDTKESALIHMSITLSKTDATSGAQGATHVNGNGWNIDSYKPEITPLIIDGFQPQETPDTAKQKQILERFTYAPGLFSIGGQNISVELATTSAARITGLSNRKFLPQETGLLFVFDSSDRQGIWMKDMLFPIDIYWFDDNFKLIHKEYSVATSTYPHVFYPEGKARYVLETSVGALEPMSLTRDLTGQLTLTQRYDKR